MKKMDLRKNFGMFPLPVVLIGSKFEERENFMTAAWVVQVNFNPPKIGFVLSNDHLTSEFIKKTGQFSINIPTESMMKKADYVGIYSGKEVEKDKIFEVFYGDLKNIPMIKGCSICMECELTQTEKISGDPFFIGDVKNIYSDEEFMTDGKPDFSKMKPLIFSSADGTYWNLRSMVGQAWKEGTEL